MKLHPKTLGLLAAAVAATLVFSACSSSATSKTPTSTGGKLTVGLPSEPATLDFQNNGDAPLPLLYNVYETLVRTDQSGAVIPSLAKSYDVSPDRKTYTFHLVDGAKFSNGDALTAKDAKYSIERVKSAKYTDGSKSGMDVVDSVEAPDDATVVVTLKRPSNAWLYKMTSRIGVMLDKAATNDLATSAIGTGPYTLGTWKRRESISLPANPHYWGKRAGFDEIDLKFFKDATAANNAMLSGSIDVLGLIQDPTVVDQFKGNKAFQILEGTSPYEVVMAMNGTQGPMKSKTLRQAVKYGIDHKALIDTCYNGRGTLIGSMVPPSDPWYENLTGKYPYDPAKAKQLLAASGEADQTILLTVPTLPAYQACGQVVQSQLQRLGFKVKLKQLEFPAVFFKQVIDDAKYDMNITGHFAPRDMCDVFSDPKYYTHYGSPAFAELCKKADEGTPEDQVKYLKQAAELLSTDAAADWLFLIPNLIVAKSGITGLPANVTSESFDLTGAART